MPGARALECAVGGCRERSATTCPRCGRAVCGRHAGFTPPPSSGRARTAAGAGRSGSAPRCAQCRLEERRRGQATVRRVWWAISAVGFVILLGVAFRGSVRLGIELLALAIVLLVLAYLYDRALRRR